MSFFRLGKIVVMAAVAATNWVCFSQQNSLRLSTTSPRPLFDLIGQLNEKFKWCVNYEEAPVVAADDLIDITSPKYAGPGRAYKFFAKPVYVRTDLPDGDVASSLGKDDLLSTRARQEEAIRAVLHAYEASGNRGLFTVSRHGRYIDVFPNKMRDQNGNYQPFEALLSTKISIRAGVYRLDQLIWLVCDQITKNRGFPIIHGNTPAGTLMSITLQESAYEQPAREVLLKAFEDSKAIRAAQGAYDVRYFRWALLYDPDGQGYAMNIGSISIDLQDGQRPSQTVTSQSPKATWWEQRPSPEK
jgi:hypothetical protein